MVTAVAPAPDFDSTIAIETFNYVEGVSSNSVARALRAAAEIDQREGPIEIMLIDVSGKREMAQLAAAMTRVRYVDAAGLGYDEAKALAAQLARGRIMVYLDCDCRPSAAWFERLTAPVRNCQASATVGFPVYGETFWAKLQFLMDFGFMLPREDRALGCYPSNNSAFARDVLLRLPEPDGPMRCRCYAHAQLLARAGYPVRLIPGAIVTHEPPPFWRERLRQGYDMIAACWTDRQLPEARWLRYRIAAAPLYYRRRVRLDWEALRHYRQAGFTRGQALACYPLLACARVIDLIGVIGALAFGPRSRGWFDRTFARLGAATPGATPADLQSEG